jgi:8-oxo-dGTP diphosphatase
LIFNPKLCGVKQFPIEAGRYIVFLFSTDKYEGNLTSSEEGTVHWVKKNELSNINLVEDFEELLQVILDDNLNEFQYIIENNEWKILIK